jgi:sigma-E factor negative regulatory protein RseA
MTELIREQMSAFVDDALSTEESVVLLHRLREDSDLGRTYACYHLIGASMRREPDASQLAARVREALRGEVHAPRTSARPGWGRVLKPAAGVAIAAAVAVVAVTALRSIESERGAALAPTATVAGRDDAYVVPERNAEGGHDVADPAGQARLAGYLVRHANYATMPNPPVMNFRSVGGARHLATQGTNAAEDDAAPADTVPQEPPAQ